MSPQEIQRKLKMFEELSLEVIDKVNCNGLPLMGNKCIKDGEIRAKCDNYKLCILSLEFKDIKKCNLEEVKA